MIKTVSVGLFKFKWGNWGRNPHLLPICTISSTVLPDMCDFWVLQLSRGKEKERRKERKENSQRKQGKSNSSKFSHITGSWYMTRFLMASAAHFGAKAALKWSKLSVGNCSRRRFVPLQWVCYSSWCACQLPHSRFPGQILQWLLQPSGPGESPEPCCAEKHGIRDSAWTWTLPECLSDKCPAAAEDKARPFHSGIKNLPPWRRVPCPCQTHTAAFPSLILN